MTPEELHRKRRAHLRALKAEVRRLTLALKRLGAEKVWLIGSLANGTANLYSDADMVAVMRSRKPFVDRLASIYCRLGPCNVDLLVYTPEEYELMRSRPFLKCALKTAKVMHEKRRPHRIAEGIAQEHFPSPSTGEGAGGGVSVPAVNSIRPLSPLYS